MTELPSKRFSFQDFHIQVACTAAADLAWLEEFLSPQFAVSIDGAASTQVTLRNDTANYQRLLARGPRPDGANATCFAMDNSYACYPFWDADGNVSVIFDEELSVFYHVDAADRHVVILAPETTTIPRLALLRVVRELALANAQGENDLVVHGAAVSVTEGGIVFSGPKRAGKTTLLVHTLNAGIARYLSNDRILVTTSPSGATMRGIPTVVSIRPDTLTFHQQLDERLQSRRYKHRSTLAEANSTAGEPATARAGKNRSISPAQLCDVLKVASVGTAPLRALVFPHIDENDTAIALTPLDGAEALPRLRAGLFPTALRGVAQTVFSWAGNAPAHDNAALESLMCRLIKQVQCFDCRLGRHAYEGEGAAKAFVERVTASL